MIELEKPSLPGKRLFAVVLACCAVALVAGGCSAWRVMFPSHAHESEAPTLPTGLQRPALLLFTKTNGFRHEEAIPAGVALFEELAAQRGWSIYRTDNGAVFDDALLANFDATIWHNVSGDVLDEAQWASLQGWLRDGGGWVGVHGSGGDSSYDSQWYVDELVGAQFIGHTMGPQFQQGRLVVEGADHPATRNLPATWMHTEEWYSFDESVRSKPGYRVLVSVDEASYSPRLEMLWMDRDIAMGDHPIVWSHCVGRGRALFSALGHQAEAYATPQMRALLEGAVAWAARVEGSGCN